MSLVVAARAVHVVTGAAWLLATLAVAMTRRARRAWLLAMLGLALLNMLAGIDLWHALHAGPWGTAEHLLAVGTLCAFVALGLQAPVALMQPPEADRLARPALAIYRITLLLILAAGAAMIASRL